MDPIASPKTRRMTRVKKVFRKRWVWACLILLVWLILIGVTVNRYAPKPRVKGPGEDVQKYKFMHCDQCMMEMPYNPALDGTRCPKCQPPKTGFFMPTETSAKTGAASMSPWMKVYVGWLVETVLMLAGLTYVLYRPLDDPTKQFFVVSCPTCNQRLRYRAVSHGGLGSCSRCKRMLRFPSEDDAVSEEEVLRADAAAAADEYNRALDEADAQAQADEDARHK
jgi:uncharacterized paraquat-inducible protein A